MKCPIFGLETDNLEINIINTIEQKQLDFFTDLFEKISKIDTDLNQYQLFKKYFDIYIYSNLWVKPEKEVHIELIKYIIKDTNVYSVNVYSFTKEINYINIFLDDETKGPFWINIINMLLDIESYKNTFDEKDYPLDFFKSIKTHLEKINHSLLMKLVNINKKYIVQSPLWMAPDINKGILCKIINSNILFTGIKVDIFLVFLKDKLLRDDILAFMTKLVLNSNSIKNIEYGAIDGESLTNYKKRMEEINKKTKFYYNCLTVFYFLLDRGIKSDDSIEKIHFNYIKSFKCPFNFCDTKNQEDTQKYNFMTRIFFMNHKLIDNIYITSYNEIEQRNTIIKGYNDEIEYLLENSSYELISIDMFTNLKKLEEERLEIIDKCIRQTNTYVSKFFKITSKWILVNSFNINIGELDSILNIFMVYFSQDEYLKYHKELFDVLTFLMGKMTITNNIMLQIKCLEIIYSFITNPDTTGNWHVSLYFENIIDEFNDKLMYLFIKSKQTFEEFDFYYSSLLIYKFIYIFNNINIYETIELKDKKLTKQFIKLVLENSISNIEYLNLTLDNYDKYIQYPEEQQEESEIKKFKTKISNLNIFINANNITLLFLNKSFKEIFIDEDIINTFSIYLSTTLSKFIDIKNSVKKTTMEEYKFYPIIINLEKIIRYHNNNEKLLSLILDNTNSKILVSFKLIQDYLTSQGLYENTLAFNLNFLQTLLIHIDKKNKEMVDHEPPDELLDPIMQTLIETPVILPNTDIIVDKDVISRHLLTDNYNPFNRETLTIETLEEYNTKEEAVIKIKAFQEKVQEWRHSLSE